MGAISAFFGVQDRIVIAAKQLARNHIRDAKISYMSTLRGCMVTRGDYGPPGTRRLMTLLKRIEERMCGENIDEA
jgi:hypothetical protein